MGLGVSNLGDGGGAEEDAERVAELVGPRASRDQLVEIVDNLRARHSLSTHPTVHNSLSAVSNTHPSVHNTLSAVSNTAENAQGVAELVGPRASRDQLVEIAHHLRARHSLSNSLTRLSLSWGGVGHG